MPILNTTKIRFIEPMLAGSSMRKCFIPGYEYYAEEKFDGHRLIVAHGQSNDLFGEIGVTAWSRNAIERPLPPHIREVLDKFPMGIYDGELMVPGKRSYGVTELTNSGDLVYQVFDVLEVAGNELLHVPYIERHKMLAMIFDSLKLVEGPVRLSHTWKVENEEQINALAQAIWDRDGEGLIVKRLTSTYAPGKRNKDWFKIKKLRTSVMTIVKFKEGKLGPCSIVWVRGADGFETSVKAKNYEELDAIEANPEAFIGRKLVIEYQERTPDGSYRHPRWDHWAEEGDI